MTTATPRFVLVGHCGPDQFMLKNALGRFAAGTEIVTSNDSTSLEPFLSAGNVLLINRVLDGSFDAADGINLIRTIANREDAPALLLISNYPEAQAAAVARSSPTSCDKAHSRMASRARREKSSCV